MRHFAGSTLLFFVLTSSPVMAGPFRTSSEHALTLSVRIQALQSAGSVLCVKYGVQYELESTMNCTAMINAKNRSLGSLIDLGADPIVGVDVDSGFATHKINNETENKISKNILNELPCRLHFLSDIS